MKKTAIFSISIIILSVLVGLYLYPAMPEKIASHWDMDGNVNGYSSRDFGLFFVPAISIGLFLLLMAVPYIDPQKKNILKFREEYDLFILMILCFLFYIHLLTLLWNLGYKFNFMQVLSPAFALLFLFLSRLMSKAKKNWFIGIRTPWTLESDDVWDKTHKLGAKLYSYAAIIAFAGVFLPAYAFILLIGPVIIVSLYLLIYSYIIYKKKD